MFHFDAEWLRKAVQTIIAGIADKLFKDNVTVYKVKENLIRVDIKIK